MGLMWNMELPCTHWIKGEEDFDSKNGLDRDVFLDVVGVRSLERLARMLCKDNCGDVILIFDSNMNKRAVKSDSLIESRREW